MSWFKLESSPMCHDKEKDKSLLKIIFFLCIVHIHSMTLTC